MKFLRPAALVAVLALAACAATEDDLAEPFEPIGDFRLGHNIVVGETARIVPPSREATAEEWEAALGGAIAERLGRYEGEGLYHLGVSVDAYALAVPGIPVVVKPRSVLAVSVNLWNNATRSKLNPEPHRITVFEGLSEETFIGSGLTRSKDEQMRALSLNAARAIERWLAENVAWFAPGPAAAGTAGIPAN